MSGIPKLLMRVRHLGTLLYRLGRGTGGSSARHSEVAPVLAEMVAAGVTGRYRGLKLLMVAQPVSPKP